MTQQPQPSKSSHTRDPEGADGAVWRASVVDSEGYNGSVRGVDISAIRIGASREPNSVATVSDDALTITGVHVGFPIATTTQIPDDSLIVTRIRAAAPGSRWVGIPLQAGQSLLYGPAVEHAGINLPGTAFTFVAVGIESVEQQADLLRSPSFRIDPGAVRDVTALTDFDVVTDACVAIADLRAGTVPLPNVMDDLLSHLAIALGRQDEPARVQRRQDRVKIVRRCLELAESVDGRPSIRELCLAAGVPERTLREAFITLYDAPPSVFFRHWALDRAFSRLSAGVPIVGGVTEVALGAGFGHFGRFAQYYRQAYGESPSETYGLRGS